MGSFALLGIATTLLLALAPATATAESSAAFTVHGSNGFAIDVGSEGGLVTVAASERRPPIATFSPSGRPRPADTGNGAASIYYARGSGADPTAISARLGRLGRISVEFRPSGATSVTLLPGSAAGPCAGAVRIVRRLGTFTGTIEFAGEDGYTAVATSRARGSVGTPLPDDCPDRPASSGAAAALASPWPDPGAAVLRARDRGAATSFKAITTDTGVAFLATLQERRDDGLLVSRRAYAGAPPSAFAFNRALTAARVKPPAPFAGVGRYRAGSRRGVSWEGNLTATFPGVNLPMTGPGFRPSLEPGR